MILDDIDYQIIQLLIQDARIPAQEIANKTNKHLTTITRRLKTLEEEGIIQGYTAVVDFEKLGLELTVITELTFTKGKLFEAEVEIAKLPGVCSVYDVTGKKFRTLLVLFPLEPTFATVRLSVKCDLKFPVLFESTPV